MIRNDERGMGGQVWRLRGNSALLTVTLIGVAVYAQGQRERAEAWRREALQLKSVVAAAPAPVAPRAETYPVTLIGADGSKTPLTGTALHIDLGENRVLEVELARRPDGYLSAWAPPAPDNESFNRIIFHPRCANAFYLELKPVSRR